MYRNIQKEWEKSGFFDFVLYFWDIF